MSDRLGLAMPSWFAAYDTTRLLNLVSVDAAAAVIQRALQSPVKPGPTDLKRHPTMEIIDKDGAIRFSQAHEDLDPPAVALKRSQNSAAADRSRRLQMDPSMVAGLRGLIAFLKEHGVNVILAQTPYHPGYFAALQGSPYLQDLQQLDQLGRSIAKEMAVPVAAASTRTSWAACRRSSAITCIAARAASARYSSRAFFRTCPRAEGKSLAGITARRPRNIRHAVQFAPFHLRLHARRAGGLLGVGARSRTAMGIPLAARCVAVLLLAALRFLHSCAAVLDSHELRVRRCPVRGSTWDAAARPDRGGQHRGQSAAARLFQISRLHPGQPRSAARHVGACGTDAAADRPVVFYVPADRLPGRRQCRADAAQGAVRLCAVRQLLRPRHRRADRASQRGAAAVCGRTERRCLPKTVPAGAR